MRWVLDEIELFLRSSCVIADTLHFIRCLRPCLLQVLPSAGEDRRGAVDNVERLVGWVLVNLSDGVNCRRWESDTHECTHKLVELCSTNLQNGAKLFIE